MVIQTHATSLKEFLNVTAGSREIGLIIAKDSEELDNLTHSLNELGLKPSEKVTDLLTLKKSFFVIEGAEAKDAYDFALQYPSGQVEIFNKKEMKSEIFSPDYANLNIIFLVQKGELKKLESSGLNFLSITGGAYQL